MWPLHGIPLSRFYSFIHIRFPYLTHFVNFKIMQLIDRSSVQRRACHVIKYSWGEEDECISCKVIFAIVCFYSILVAGHSIIFIVVHLLLSFHLRQTISSRCTLCINSNFVHCRALSRDILHILNSAGSKDALFHINHYQRFNWVI